MCLYRTVRIILVLIMMVWVKKSVGSWGDQDSHYRNCLKTCWNSCNHAAPESVYESDYRIPLIQLVPLSCPELCKYDCIHSNVDHRAMLGMRLVKYYGHWPCIRYFGLEEPAAVLFSLLNIIPHLKYLLSSLIRRTQPLLHPEKLVGTTSFMQASLQCYALTACIAWICSALYHAKKTPFTTQCDLISALGFIICGLYIVIRRFMGIRIATYRVYLLIVGLVACWALRSRNMLRGSVSFDSHMNLSISIVILTTILWFAWVVFYTYDWADLNTLPMRTADINPLSSNIHSNSSSAQTKRFQAIRKVKAYCVLCQVWLIFAAALEIFDFPPIVGAFDAHALWHAATVPLGFLWYQFWSYEQALHWQSATCSEFIVNSAVGTFDNISSNAYNNDDVDDIGKHYRSDSSDRYHGQWNATGSYITSDKKN